MGELELPYKRKSFNITDSAFACVLFILFNFIFVFAYSFIPTYIRANRFVFYTASFLVEFVFAVAAWTVAKARNVDLIPATGMNKKINIKLVGYGLLISLICLIFFASLTSTFVDFLYVCGYRSILPDFKFGSFWVYLIYVVITCIAPALFEELLFRGVIQSGFKAYGEKLAIIVSALIFMIMHGNAEQTVHQFIIGLVIGFIFIKSGNLWIGVIVHFFNNFISITQSYIFEAIASNSQPVEDVTDVAQTVVANPWLVLLMELIISLIWAYVGYSILKYLLKKTIDENNRINNNANLALNQNETETIISVDGEAETAVMEVSAAEGSEEKTSVNENSEAGEGSKKKEGFSVPCIIMFVLSGLYLVAEWIMSLLDGFGI